jgi:hypothetical protein
MERCLNWILAATVLLPVVGCSSSSSSESGSSSSTTATTVPTASDDSAAKAASDFLDAVIKGDTERASRRLTPLAIERITQSGKQFAPPGLDTASFRIGETRKPTDTQAIVQCILSDATPDGQQRSEEIACLLRLVEGDWRVSGIAYVPGPNRPPMILSFEHPQQGAVSSQPPMANSAGDTNGQAGRPSPPRTAQEASPAASYR